jgi:hypothetical protein
MPARLTSTMFERFHQGYIITGSECWEWTKTFDGKGYGVIYDDSRPRRPMRAHRYGYTLATGDLAVGMDIDHICRNKKCVNPEHLEAVTHKENVLRGLAPNILAHHQNVCKRGHEMNDQNTYYRRNGTRQCRVCHRLEMRGYEARRTSQKEIA